METTQELNFLSTLFPLVGIIFIIAFGVILLNQHFRKNLIQQKLGKEELKAKHGQELLRSSIEAQEKERKRIANDLHDELGAALSIARMHIIQLEEKNKNDDEQLKALNNIKVLTESALASMRRISHELMPPQLETFGIIKTLESLALRINTTNSIQLHINADDLPPISWNIELGLYRIILELITNTIKHAKAKEIKINFYRSMDGLVVQYNDDGIGCKNNSSIEGLGTQSLKARISALSGSIRPMVSNEPGFNVKLEIPLNE